MKKKITILTILLIQSISSFSQEMTFIDTVSFYFQEIQNNTNQHKDLWGIDLYGPILLVNPITRQTYANEPDSAGVLKPEGKIFTGQLPKRINIANTAINWNGKLWAMIMLPLSDNKQKRLDLLSHELFHCSQPVLGFNMKNLDNVHLDQKDGRMYLRLELEALRQALLAKSIDDTKSHLTNAIIFRKYRYTIYPEAAVRENLLELNEGLATYTGIIMCGRNDSEIKKAMQESLADFLQCPTFVRSFPYQTTPFYGYILSKSMKHWNKQINENSNLIDYFVKAFDLYIPKDLAIARAQISNQYGGEKIFAEETARELKTKQRVDAYKIRFIDSPHLVIYFGKMNISFNPNNIMPLEENGTVYPTLRVSDNWGVLTVTEDALLGANWEKVTVSEPITISTEKVAGNGWTLDLNKGYFVEKDSVSGNYNLKKE